MAIIISRDGVPAKRVEKSPFDGEGHLQKYIYDNPNSIPLYEIKEDVRLLILAREFVTKNGYLDAIGIDGDGEIYLVETKLYKNPDKRLVVAQVLDYGASLWRNNSNPATFLAALDAEVNKKHGESLSQRITSFFNLDEASLEDLLGRVSDNLSHGNFRFVVLMDTLHPQLKDLILYINQNSNFTVYAVELEHYNHEQYEIVIPRIHGAEAKKTMASTAVGVRKQWTEESYLSELKQNLKAEQLQAALKLYNYSEDKADQITFGTGNKTGSANPKFSRISQRSPYTICSNGVLSINFCFLYDDEETKRKRAELRAALAPLFSIPQDYENSYLNLKPENWTPKVDRIIKIIEKMTEE